MALNSQTLNWTRSLVFALLVALAAAGCSKSGRPDTRPEATLAELNKYVGYLMMNGQAPQDVYGLTNLPAMKNKRLPTPPPGKRLVIDPATQRVVFAD